MTKPLNQRNYQFSTKVYTGANEENKAKETEMQQTEKKVGFYVLL